MQAVRPGLPGKAVAAGYPDLKLPAKVREVSAIPVTAGSFEAKLTVDMPKDAEALMPGMACTVKLVAYAKADALTVPATAVFSEELDEDKHFVYLLVKDGKHEKRTVTVGKKTDGKIEIVQGLQAGDEILLEKPGDAARTANERKGGTP